MHITSQFVFPAAATACALLGAAFDIKSRRIPNFITGPAILAGLLLHLSLEGWHGLFNSLSAGLLCGMIFLIFYLAGGMGAGDVKLITAAGCLAGFANVGYLLILTSIAGGVMGILVALLRGKLKSTLENVRMLFTHHRYQGLNPHPELNVRNNATIRLPYGVAIAAGCCLTLILHGTQR